MPPVQKSSCNPIIQYLNRHFQVNSSTPYIVKLIPILLSHGQVFFSALLLGVCHYKSIGLNVKLRCIVHKLIKIDKIMTEQLGIRINHTYMRYLYKFLGPYTKSDLWMNHSNISASLSLYLRLLETKPQNEGLSIEVP